MAWASVLSLMRGEVLPEYLPPYWVEFFMNLTDREPLALPDIEMKVGKEYRKKNNNRAGRNTAGIEGKDE